MSALYPSSVFTSSCGQFIMSKTFKTFKYDKVCLLFSRAVKKVSTYVHQRGERRERKRERGNFYEEFPEKNTAYISPSLIDVDEKMNKRK